MNQPSLRRSQADRAASTRKSVLDAAISELYDHGYGATTMAMIADKAGVSRGAMLNHFPTKADLMTFVVEEAYRNEVQEYERILRGVDNPSKRLIAYISAAWQVMSQPPGVAMMEILLGCRSDVALAAKLKPIQERIETDSYAVLERELGRPPMRSNVILVTWAMRGLAIRNVIQGDEGTEAAVGLLRQYVESALTSGVLPPLE